MREIFETNTFGAFATCRAIIPQMRQQGHGAIINVTSSTGIGPMPLAAIYTASKCAVEGFTESLSYELDVFNIKARLVEPGYAPTTNSSANTGTRLQGLIPADYDSFARSYFQKLANDPTPYCTEAEVAESTFLAATDQGHKIWLSSRPRQQTTRRAALDNFGRSLPGKNARHVQRRDRRPSSFRAERPPPASPSRKRRRTEAKLPSRTALPPDWLRCQLHAAAAEKQDKPGVIPPVTIAWQTCNIC